MLFRSVPPLPLATAQAIAEAFHREGAAAKVSSIHVNAWFGDHDKLTMSEWFLREAFDIRLETDLRHIAYCGDSPNDAPMFAHFEHSVGVANVRDFAGRINSTPAWITGARSGAGFCEFADALLAAR